MWQGKCRGERDQGREEVSGSAGGGRERGGGEGADGGYTRGLREEEHGRRAFL